jgi:hypothetical protein
VRPLTILFSGMIAGDPGQGGAAWAVLQYVLGLRRLGHSVYFVEPVRTGPPHPTIMAYFTEVTRTFGLEGAAALLPAGARQTVGLPYEQLLEIAGRADVLINVSGMLSDDVLVPRVPVRVYLDLDPAFVQLWHATQTADMRFAGHTHFVTVGQSIGGLDCDVPTCGLDWIPTLQPVVLERWPAIGPDGPVRWDALTTVANWRGYGSIEHGGVHYGQKAHSLRRLIDLPRLTRERFTLALSIHPQEVKDVEALSSNGWQRVDPADVAATPAQYQRFVQGSKAEFGLAKSGYVASRCGWFSDRSACYLASGRPVVAQDTGFSRHLPTGEGLFAFNTVDEAAAAIEVMNRDYRRHCRAARALAEEYFDSDKVIGTLLRRIGVAP